MRIVFDIECNSLNKPAHIWCIVAKDLDTGERYVFRNLTTDDEERERFILFSSRVTYWVGHNILGYDLPVIQQLLDLAPAVEATCDTFIISKMMDYSRPGGHSLEQYGLEFGDHKNQFNDFSKWSEALEERCSQDVDINHKVYLKYLKQIDNKDWSKSIALEHNFQTIVNNLSTNGFSFNIDKCSRLLTKVTKELSTLDSIILKQFTKRSKLVRVVIPKGTKYGTISLSSIPLSIRKAEGFDLSAYSIDAPFSYFKWEEFNPSSHKQLIEVLNNSGWSPTDKTSTHIDLEREINRLKHSRERSPELDLRLKECYTKLETMKKSGWKINENNLLTLPENAPAPARSLAKRILLESRRRTLTEWLALADTASHRIHGKFYGIGAWTHRMAHQNPNTANIPTDAKLFGGEMRSLWQAPRNRLLVGVDAEGIQLRIFAHYINDPEFTDALVKGKKDDKTDPHSLNQRILGPVCKTRAHAKRFIFAYLLGAGIGKLAEILGCSESEGKEALDRLVDRYEGLAVLKATVIPADAKRGWFVGLDGRKVRIPGDTPGTRKHLCMSGYLQNGEAVVMKAACIKWHEMLKDEPDWKIVNFVHDEWQTECKNDMAAALRIAKAQAESLRLVGEEFKLNCPLAGSYYNEDIQDYTIGSNWKVTH